MAGGRQVRPPGTSRRLSTLLLILVPTVSVLLLLAFLLILVPTVSVLLLLAFLLSAAVGGGAASAAPTTPAAAALLCRQEDDHLAVIHAYAAYARHLKLQSSRQYSTKPHSSP